MIDPRCIAVRARRAARALLAGAMALLCTSPAARAQDARATRPRAAPKVDVRYDVVAGAGGCLAEDAFRDAVRRRLPEDALASGAEIVVATRIERDGQRLRATIELHEHRSVPEPSAATQEIVAGLDDCATLSAAAALAVSLTIERSRSQVVEAPPPAEEAPSSSPTPALPGEAARSKPSSRARPASTRPSSPPPPADGSAHSTIQTHARFALGYGILPGISTGTAFGASLKLGRWSTGLEGAAWLPATIESASGREGANAWVVLLSGSACANAGQAFACAVGVVGNFRASGTGRLLSRSAGSIYPALGARVGTEIPIVAPFSVVLHGGVLAPLVRPVLRTGDELLWRAPVLAGELGIGISVSIL